MSHNIGLRLINIKTFQKIQKTILMVRFILFSPPHLTFYGGKDYFKFLRKILRKFMFLFFSSAHRIILFMRSVGEGGNVDENL